MLTEKEEYHCNSIYPFKDSQKRNYPITPAKKYYAFNVHYLPDNELFCRGLFY